MKALPLWQPWASLVAIGAKRVETRSWAAPASVVGERIAIHATKTKSHLWVVATEPFKRRLREAVDAGDLTFIDGELPLGAVIATAVLDRCTEMDPAMIGSLRGAHPDEFAFGHYEPGRFAWVLRDIVQLNEPVPFVGRQGMFDIADHLVGAPPAPALVRYRCSECGHVEDLDPRDWQECLPACPVIVEDPDVVEPNLEDCYAHCPGAEMQPIATEATS